MTTLWRVGRKLGRSIYEQLGPEPSDADRFLGLMDTVELAKLIVDEHNRAVAMHAASAAHAVWAARFDAAEDDL